MSSFPPFKLAKLQRVAQETPSLKASGRVVGVRGPLVLAHMPHALMGQLCYVTTLGGRQIAARVASFHEGLISLAPLDHLTGISPGSEVKSAGITLQVSLPKSLTGRVIDCMGTPIDGKSQGKREIGTLVPVERPPPDPLSRIPINRPLTTGIRSLDGLCPIGYGQRIGLFAPAGLGKSTLLGMIARGAGADINVIALVAERGREVNDFIREVLGPDGLEKSVLVIATSDECPARRQLAAYTATTVAEHFRDQGLAVLLLVDSLTRTARAIREVGLAAGELPVRQGYTSSVYTELPRLLERAGPGSHGSITAIYTILTAADHDLDPLSDEVKSLLDGHIVLDPSLAAQGFHPAIDLTQSVSRLMPRLIEAETLTEIRQLIRMLARLKKDRDIILFGGTPDKELGTALTLEPKLREFLCQPPGELSTWKETRQRVAELAVMAR